MKPRHILIEVEGELELSLPLRRSARRFAGHLETGKPSFSDPAMKGVAIVDQ
jgi:hypothetical protein